MVTKATTAETEAPTANDDEPVIEVKKRGRKSKASVTESPKEVTAARLDGTFLTKEVQTQFPSISGEYGPNDMVIVNYVNQRIAQHSEVTPMTTPTGDPVLINFSKPGVSFIPAIPWEYYAASPEGVSAINQGRYRFICKYSKAALYELSLGQKQDLISNCWEVAFLRSWADSDPAIMVAVDARIKAIREMEDKKITVMPM